MSRAERSPYSPFLNSIMATDGMTLLSVATYSHVPRILMFMRNKHTAVINRQVANGIDIDESLCAKMMKYLAKNGLVCPTNISGHRGPVYTLSDMGMKCADCLVDIVIYGDLNLVAKKDAIQSIEETEEVKV